MPIAKSWYCRYCKGGAPVMNNDEEPKICPYCGRDERGDIHKNWRNKYVGGKNKLDDQSI